MTMVMVIIIIIFPAVFFTSVSELAGAVLALTSPGQIKASWSPLQPSASLQESLRFLQKVECTYDAVLPCFTLYANL